MFDVHETAFNENDNFKTLNNKRNVIFSLIGKTTAYVYENHNSYTDQIVA